MKTFYWSEQKDGLGICVHPSGAMDFYHSYRLKGRGVKRRKICRCRSDYIAEDLVAARIIHTERYEHIRIGKDPDGEDKVDTAPPSCIELMRLYLDFKVNHSDADIRIKPKTAYGYERQIEYIKENFPDFANKSVVEFDALVAEDLLDCVLKKAKVSKKSSDGRASVNRIRALLHASWQFGILRRRIEGLQLNPWQFIEKMKEKPRRTRLDSVVRRKFILHLEQLEVEQSGFDYVWAMIMWTLLLSGARPSEVLSLLLGEELKVDNNPPYFQKIDTKTGERIDNPVFLPQQLVEKLNAYLEWRSMEEKFSGNPYVFPGNVPNRHLVNYKDKWRSFFDSIGGMNEWGRITPYSIRREFASIGNKTVGRPKTSELLDHASEGITEIYIVESQEEKMERLIANSVQNQRLADAILGKHGVNNEQN